MRVRFLDAAKADVVDAALYYERQRSGLGVEFSLEVDRRAADIEQFPFASAILDGSIRILMTRRFPYGLMYQVDAQDAVVIAVVHLHREPRHWLNRVQDS
jgi:hypothetical protein